MCVSTAPVALSANAQGLSRTPDARATTAHLLSSQIFRVSLSLLSATASLFYANVRADLPCTHSYFVVGKYGIQQLEPLAPKLHPADRHIHLRLHRSRCGSYHINAMTLTRIPMHSSVAKGSRAVAVEIVSRRQHCDRLVGWQLEHTPSTLTT